MSAAAGAAATTGAGAAKDKARGAEHAVKQQTAGPEQTLYVRNLTERVSKDALRRALYTLFSKLGSVLDVSVGKKNTTRGQAWVVFADVDAASKAKAALHGFSFLGRPLDVHFSSAPSDVVAIARGQAPRASRKRTVASAPAASVDSGAPAKRSRVE